MHFFATPCSIIQNIVLVKLINTMHINYVIQSIDINTLARFRSVFINYISFLKVPLLTN